MNTMSGTAAVRSVIQTMRHRCLWTATSYRSAPLPSPLRLAISPRYSFISTLVSSDNILSSPFRERNIPEVNFAHFIFSETERFKDSVALIDGATGQKYTYEQLLETAGRVARSLSALGYIKGDIIALHTVNQIEYPVIILAAALIGVIVSPVNPSFTPGELRMQLQRTRARGIITTSSLASVTLHALASDPKVDSITKDRFVFGEAEGFRPVKMLLAGPSSTSLPDVKINPKEDVLVLPFSSGTTGLPKGVMLTHYNCVANLKQFQHSMRLEHGVDRVIGVLPLFHIYGLMPLLFGSIRSGTPLVTMTKFDITEYLNILQDQKITILHLVPPMVLKLAKSPLIKSCDLSSVSSAFSSSAPLGQDLTEEFQEKLQIPLFQGYGLTETSPVVSLDYAPGRIGTCGPLVANTLGKIVHPVSKETLKPGQFGEFCCKGPQVMLGYFQNPAATNEMIRDGWLHTGDLGFIDESGYVVIEDRLKDLIKYKGHQISPAELEDLLVTHPCIQDAAVVGVPDIQAGELPRAFVVLQERAKMTHQDVVSFIEDKMAPFKHLRGGAEFIDAIPKGSNGKILRRVLREQMKHNSYGHE